MASRKKILSLKQFMLRQEVIKLYKDVYRTTRIIEDVGQRQDVRKWAASEIRAHKDQTDEVTIRGLIIYGKRMVDDLKRSLKTAG